MPHISPIRYKKILTQYAFFIKKDGTVLTQIVTKLPSEQKFKSEKEAREFIRKLKEII